MTKVKQFIASTGFTLLEVMVAIAILALSLTAIFSTQVQNITNANHARWLVTANLLARCKMSEIELSLKKDGFPEADESEMDQECCEAFETDKYKCSWTIQRVELPSTIDVETAVTEAMTKESLSGFIGEFQAERINSQLQAMGGMGALSALLPIINDLMVGTIRRVEVEVEWKERSVTKKTKIAQFFVNPGEGVSGTLLQMGVMRDLIQGVTPQTPLNFDDLKDIIKPGGQK
ncbi:MAG: prepilin-type N-terminal cleavage/methylation domain-containing protein [Candidatus Omnitrophica bacterium]|nr:prepilin-type N-terminal cleavage/methylation domain-containing protein [Candidatus Omnitrophota bacterium]